MIIRKIAVLLIALTIPVSMLVFIVGSPQLVRAEHRKNCEYASGPMLEVDADADCPETGPEVDGEEGARLVGEEVIPDDPGTPPEENPGDGTPPGANEPDDPADLGPDETFVTTGICEQPDTDIPGPNGPSQNTVQECDCDADVLTPDNCDIVRYIQVGISLLSGIAGMAIVGGIMAAGYQYMTARDNPGAIAAARQRIVWALVALGILIFFWGFLQWLVPGGILGTGGGDPGFDAQRSQEYV